jgi:hypothetical protein
MQDHRRKPTFARTHAHDVPRWPTIKSNCLVAWFVAGWSDRLWPQPLFRNDDRDACGILLTPALKFGLAQFNDSMVKQRLVGLCQT